LLNPHQATPNANPQTAESQDFAHLMLKEIYEQPAALQTCLTKYLNLPWINPPQPTTPVRQNAPVEAPVPDLPIPLPDSLYTNLKQIHILACGTSRHAGLVAQYWFEQMARIPTRVRSASEFVSAPLPLSSDTLTLAITQSGETADTLAAVERQKRNYALLKVSQPRLLGITNQLDSSLALQVDYTLPTFAGVEMGVAATKTFTTQLAVLASLALDIAQRFQTNSDQQAHQIVTALRSLPDQIATILNQQEKPIQELAQKLATAKNCIVLGQGVNRAIALEGALKLKETTYIHAEGYAAGEFLHGPIALLDPTIPVIAIAPNDHTDHSTLATVRKVKSHNVPVIGITTAMDNPEAAQLFDDHITLPASHELLTPFLTVVPLQLLAYHIAIQRGLNVDRPRNITKILNH
jgi:glucosamine--fructose-6-phosphate aminotransferase (isomerizing)